MSGELRFKTIGKYEILELVGSGGLGEVYKARHMQTGQVVALKRLHDKYQNDPTLLGLFHHEIMIHAQVAHRHCIKLLDQDLTPPNAHIVTNFVQGYNGHKLVLYCGPLPPLIACSILLDLLQGIRHLHSLDIIHSDLSLSNIMIQHDGLVLVADFGLSCRAEFEDYRGKTVGTPGYQAPERLRHEPITPQADIYCAGIILYEMLKGERLYAYKTQPEVLAKMKNLRFDWIKTPFPQLDVQLRKLLSDALAFRPEDRFEDTDQFLLALYNILKAFGIKYTRRAILQWMCDRGITKHPRPNPVQKIYVDPNHVPPI